MPELLTPDYLWLSEQLKRLSNRLRVAFALTCLQRLHPYHLRHEQAVGRGEPGELTAMLERLWTECEGDVIDTGWITEGQRRLGEIVPLFQEHEWSPDLPGADRFAQVLWDTLQVHCHAGIEEAIKTAEVAQETLGLALDPAYERFCAEHPDWADHHFYAKVEARWFASQPLIPLGMTPAQERLREAVLGDAAVQTELRRQRRDLAELLACPESAALVARLRERSKGEEVGDHVPGEDNAAAEHEAVLHEVERQPPVAFAAAELPGGGRLEVAKPRDEVLIVRRSDAAGAQLAELRLDYPPHGLADGELLLSPSGCYAVLAYYSGQSEETFAFFDLVGGLALVAAPPYWKGEAGAYAFTPAEDRLLMVLPEACDAWWTYADDGDEVLERDDEGAYLPFATLVICDCASGRLSAPVRLVLVPGPGGELPEWEEWTDLAPRFTGEQSVHLTLPWGEVDLTLPAPVWDAVSSARAPEPSPVRLQYVPPGG